MSDSEIVRKFKKNKRKIHRVNAKHKKIQKANVFLFVHSAVTKYKSWLIFFCYLFSLSGGMNKKMREHNDDEIWSEEGATQWNELIVEMELNWGRRHRWFLLAGGWWDNGGVYYDRLISWNISIVCLLLIRLRKHFSDWRRCTTLRELKAFLWFESDIW